MNQSALIAEIEHKRETASNEIRAVLLRLAQETGMAPVAVRFEAWCDRGVGAEPRWRMGSVGIDLRLPGEQG